MQKLCLQLFNIQGISIEFFIKNCAFLQFCLPEISRRVLIAAGLDANSDTAIVDWDTFFKLYCIFQVGEIEVEKQAAFWTKFFDQRGQGFCSKSEYEDVLDKLIRGKTMSANNKFMHIFRKDFYEKMRSADVLGLNDEIITERLQAAFVSKKVDI